jgi:hypothetical protein
LANGEERGGGGEGNMTKVHILRVGKEKFLLLHHTYCQVEKFLSSSETNISLNEFVVIFDSLPRIDFSHFN